MPHPLYENLELMRSHIDLYFMPLFLLLSSSCTSEGTGLVVPAPQPSAFVSAVDISAFPEVEQAGVQYSDEAGNPVNLLDFLRLKRVNTIRLRLWVNPATGHSGLAEVKALSERARSKGLNIWITAHYSDTWADPANQQPPVAWQNLGFEALKTEVVQYTSRVVEELKPDILQIGNEINPGLLLPYGDRLNQPEQFVQILNEASAAARAANPETRIMLHYAGLDGASTFFQSVASVDYDLIGISYYPLWHGKNLNGLASTMDSLGRTFGKEVFLSETAYPFTLGFDDFTDNIVGWESQLILPEYPATPDGQRNFVLRLKEIVESAHGGKGICYWAPEWVAYRGPTATNGSPWENNALFDFDLRALPAWDVFETD